MESILIQERVGTCIRTACDEEFAREVIGSTEVSNEEAGLFSNRTTISVDVHILRKKKLQLWISIGPIARKIKITTHLE
jgi:hypothetical protein